MAFNYRAAGAFSKGFRSNNMKDWLLQQAISQYTKSQEEQKKAAAIKGAYQQLMPDIPIQDIDAMTQLIVQGQSPEFYFEGQERTRDIGAVKKALEGMGMEGAEAKTNAEAFAAGMPMGSVIAQVQKGKNAEAMAKSIQTLYPKMGETKAKAAADMMAAGANISSAEMEKIQTTVYFDDYLASEGYTAEQAEGLRNLPPNLKMQVMATGAEKLLGRYQTEEASERLMQMRETLPTKFEAGVAMGVDFAKMTDRQRSDFMGYLNAAIPPMPSDKNITGARNYIMYGQFTNPYEDGAQKGRVGSLNESDMKLMEALGDPKYDSWNSFTGEEGMLFKVVIDKAFNIKDAEAWAKFRGTGIAGVLPDAMGRAQSIIHNRVKQLLPGGLDMGVVIRMWQDGKLTSTEKDEKTGKDKKTGYIALEDALNKYYEFGTVTPKMPVIVKEVEQLYQATMAVEDYTKVTGLGKELLWLVMELGAKPGGWDPSYDTYLRKKKFTEAQIDDIKILVEAWKSGNYEKEVRPDIEAFSGKKRK